MTKKAKKKLSEEFIGRIVRTGEEARALGANSAGNITHGAHEFAQRGTRRCRPQWCPMKDTCSQAALEPKERPLHCVPLEEHIQRLVGALLTEERLPPHRRGIIANVARREGMLWLLANWFATYSPVFVRDHKLYSQPAMNLYTTLLAAQSRDLKMLGAHEVLHLSAGQQLAQAVDAAAKENDKDD